MRLEIRDAEDQTVYDIGPEGAVIGRERAKTDISLRDESISKRHARIFHDDGGWFVEDLGSSNGTYVDEQRISGAVLLSQGMSFSLAQRRFEILYIDSPAAAVDDFPMPGMTPPGPQDETGNDMPPLPGMESQAYVPAERSREPDMNHDDFGAEPDEDDATNQGIKYFFVAVPKAVAYYLVKVPLMGLNPIGTIRRGVEEQKLPAMSKMEIAAYAIPAGFFNALVSGVFAALAVLVNGAFGAAIGALVAALPMAAISAAIGGVFGFFAHPILEFLIRLLKGESTAKSRSNYLVMIYTFVVLSAVPKGIGLLVSSLPVPFISLLGPLLTVLVSLVGLFLAYLWVQYFQMHKAVRYVVLVLGVLSVLGTGFGFVSGLISQISNLGSGSSDSPGLVADGSDLTDEQKAALEAAKANPEAAAALAQAEAAAQAALAQAEATGGEVDERTRAALAAARKKSAEAAAMAAKQAAAAQAAAAEAAAKTPDEPEVPDEPVRAPPPTRAPPPPPTRAAPPPTRAAPPPARAAATRTVSGPINTDEHPLGRTAFVAFLDKRGAVERAIDDDPSLLRRRDIKSDYERIWEVTYDIREKYRKRYRKKDRWERDKIGSRLKGQEIFEKTNDEVERLYKTIFGR